MCAVRLRCERQPPRLAVRSAPFAVLLGVCGCTSSTEPAAQGSDGAVQIGPSSGGASVGGASSSGGGSVGGATNSGGVSGGGMTSSGGVGAGGVSSGGLPSSGSGGRADT